MTASSPSSQQQTVDDRAAAAVELARSAAVEVAGTEVGEHLGVRPEGELAVTHAFAAALPGYVGWFWAVTLVRAPDADPTVAEVVLLPGEHSLRAPDWVPWNQRLQPGDLSPGDLLPTAPDDPRLAPAYLLSDDPQVEQVSFELGLGRVRVLSRLGRLDAADRWFAGGHGPDSPMAKAAPAHCGTCGFFLPLAGSLQAGFGVCGNEITEADGQVVSVEYGCGAHSEVEAEPAAEESGEIYEDELIDLEPREPAGDDRSETEPEVAPEAEAVVEPEAETSSEPDAAEDAAAEDVVAGNVAVQPDAGTEPAGAGPVDTAGPGELAH